MKKQDKCYKCGKKGHIARNCPGDSGEEVARALSCSAFLKKRSLMRLVQWERNEERDLKSGEEEEC